jgi:starch-binding outer membrane protein, SusD/RagB family
MKTKIKYINTLILAVLISGCSDEFLDKGPIDEIVSSNFYSTEKDAQQALVAVYDVLQYQSVGAWAPFGTTSDMLSDDSFAGGGDANDGAEEDELNNFNITSTNPMVHSIWLKNYIGIARANLLLERLPEITAKTEFKERAAAECKFLRAYFYFEQVRYFENIPLLTATIKGPSEFNQSQNTPTEVYNQIALDLVEAIEVLPENMPANEIGRASKWAAESLLARVYLFYNGVYGKDLIAGSTTVDKNTALLYLEDVISKSGHALLADYSQIFRLASEYSVESVFEIGYGDSPVWWDWGYTIGGEGNLGAQMQGPRASGGSELYDRGWSFATVSNKLASDMASDPRISSTILTEAEILADPGAAVVQGYQHTGNYSKKYSSDAEHWGIGGQFELNRTSNFRVIRYSDVLLMAAELGSGNAQQYLDDVRDRVSLPSVPVTLDNIYNERRLEFALEGIRYFDVLRRGMSYAEQELTVIGDRGPNYVGDQIIFDVTFDSSTRGFLPIPQVEIDLSNGAFVQNTGY